MDNRRRRPANIRRYIYMLQRYEKPRTKQNHNAAKWNAPTRGCRLPARIWTNARRVETIQAYRHEGQTEEEQTASTDEEQTAARYRQRGQPPRRGEKGGRAALFFCRVCLFVQQEAKARKPQHSTAEGCSVYTAAPRIWTTWTIWTPPPPSIRPPPDMDKYRQRGQTPDV